MEVMHCIRVVLVHPRRLVDGCFGVMQPTRTLGEQGL